jgi:hypothetical protein
LAALKYVEDFQSRQCGFEAAGFKIRRVIGHVLLDLG